MCSLIPYQFRILKFLVPSPAKRERVKVRVKKLSPSSSALRHLHPQVGEGKEMQLLRIASILFLLATSYAMILKSQLASIYEPKLSWHSNFINLPQCSPGSRPSPTWQTFLFLLALPCGFTFSHYQPWVDSL